MQDDTTKRTTVEDQELADMIANLNSSAPPPAAAPSAAPAAPPPTAAAAPAPLPPLPPLPSAGSTPPTTPPAAPPPPPSDPSPSSLPTENSSFNIPEPTPGLPPLPTAGTPLPSAPTPPPADNDTEAFEPPVSTLPPLGQKTPLPPLPGEKPPEPDPDADIDEIAADFPEPSTRASKLSPSAKPTDLSAIKQDALDKLRPLVDELDLPAQEKFDTLLLLIRSNDDKSLIPQAYQTADQITDETARAAALLDIVKEIDYFENPS